MNYTTRQILDQIAALEDSHRECSAYAPDLPGGVGTREGVVKRAGEAARLHLASLREHGDPFSQRYCLDRRDSQEFRWPGDSRQ